jgi:uncharacterized protein (TIGR00251 family)
LTEPGAGLSLRRSPDGVSFWIHVTPRASRERVGGLHGDALRVAVREPPVAGAANAACLRALARVLHLARDAVQLDPGARGRRKRVRVAGDAEALEAALRGLAELAARRPVR